MIFVLLFIFEIVLLFFLSKKLINSLSRIIFKISRSHKVLIHTMAMIFLPGTIMHELAHLFTAGVMMVPVGELTAWPEVQNDGVRLGSVQIGKTDPLRRTLIGVAPVILGILFIIVVLYLMPITEVIWWQKILSLYLVFELGNTMFSSKKDLEGIIGFVVAILVVGILCFGGLYLINQGIFQSFISWISGLNYGPVINFFKMASMNLIIPLVLDILIILLTLMFSRRNRGNELD